MGAAGHESCHGFEKKSARIRCVRAVALATRRRSGYDRRLKERPALSETTATPALNESQVPTESREPQAPSSNPQAEANAEETATATPPGEAAKRKRKRKRRRKGAAAGNAAAGDAPPTEQAVRDRSPQSGGPVVAKPSAKPQHGKDHPGKDHPGKDHPGKAKKGRHQDHTRRPRKDGERAHRTQEQLAAWRWSPNAAQLAYFPAVTLASPADRTPVNELDPALAPSDGEGTSFVEPETATLEPSAMVSEGEPTVTTDLPTAGDDGRANEPTSTAESHSPAKWGVPATDQLGAWLGHLLSHSPQPEQAALLVSLCSHRAFRQRVSNLGGEHQTRLRPLVAVYDAIFMDSAPSVASSEQAPEQTATTDARDELRRGLAAVSQGSVDVLRTWPLPARERLVELSESFELEGLLHSNAALLFFDSPKIAGRLGLRAVCDALSHGRDAVAKDLIGAMSNQPGVPGLLPMLSEALDGQRFGSLVILSYGGAQSRGPDPKAPKRHAAFCLESQRDVWLRSGETQDAAQFEHYSQVHRKALLPGVVGLYAFGVTRSRKPYAAVLRKGISLQRKLGHGWGLPRQAAVGLATELTLLASGLCRAGLRLPDLDPRRFELDEEGRVWLSDLWGAELMEPRAQDNAAVSVCRETVVQLLANQPSFTLPNDWREVLSHSADFETIVATLRKLEKSRFWST